MSKKFKHLNLSPHWQQYFAKYPQGYTIIENLIDWVSQVDDMVDSYNELTDHVDSFKEAVNNTTDGLREELDTFLRQFDDNLALNVITTLSEWENSGFLDIVIDEALNTKYHEMDERLTSQLAETREYNGSLLSQGNRRKKPVFTFTSDDAVPVEIDTYIPIMQEYNITIGTGVITSTIGNEGMSFEQLRQFENAGGEIMFHSHTHMNYAYATEDEIVTDVETGLNLLNAEGFYPETFVYPFNDVSAHSISIIRRYFDYAFAKTYGSNMGKNFPTMRNQRIDRVALGSFFDVPDNHPEYPQDGSSLEYYKARVDEAFENNSWLVFVMHAQGMSEIQKQYIRDIIEYIRYKGGDILSPSEAFRRHGNIVELSSETSDFRIDSDGNFVGQNFSVVDSEPNTFLNSDDLTKYRDNTVHHTYITSSESLGLPLNSGGILTTYRVGNQYAYTTQEFRPYYAVGLWQRTAQPNGTWGAWTRIDKQNVHTFETDLNVYTDETLPTEFPIGMTTFVVTGSETTGLPDNRPGMVTVYRLGGQLGFTKAEYRPYNTVGLWQKTSNNSGEWQPWVNLRVSE